MVVIGTTVTNLMVSIHPLKLAHPVGSEFRLRLRLRQIDNLNQLIKKGTSSALFYFYIQTN
jgi:hypothetical protein